MTVTAGRSVPSELALFAISASPRSIGDELSRRLDSSWGWTFMGHNSAKFLAFRWDIPLDELHA